jgi:hypothetical protein
MSISTAALTALRSRSARGASVSFLISFPHESCFVPRPPVSAGKTTVMLSTAKCGTASPYPIHIECIRGDNESQCFVLRASFLVRRCIHHRGHRERRGHRENDKLTKVRRSSCFVLGWGARGLVDSRHAAGQRIHSIPTRSETVRNSGSPVTRTAE